MPWKWARTLPPVKTNNEKDHWVNFQRVYITKLPPPPLQLMWHCKSCFWNLKWLKHSHDMLSCWDFLSGFMSAILFNSRSCGFFWPLPGSAGLLWASDHFSLKLQLLASIDQFIFISPNSYFWNYYIFNYSLLP